VLVVADDVDPRAPLPGFPPRFVVGHGHDGQGDAAGADHRRRGGGLQVRPGAGEGDPRRAQQVQALQQRLRAVVQHVVVGEAHEVHRRRPERLQRPRAGAEAEQLGGIAPAARGDHALQVDEARVRAGEQREGIAPWRRRRLRRIAQDARVDQAAEHHVAGHPEAEGARVYWHRGHPVTTP